MTTNARTIAATIHGRYLVDAPDERPAGVLVGCHGYAEDAEVQFERLRSIAGSDHWVRVSVQALHRFYRGRSQDVVASWMTRQDRELMIADNINYVTAVVASVTREADSSLPSVFVGFSQGVATAFRVACASAARSAVIALGGDIPPEIDAAALWKLRAVLIGHGLRDEWYTQKKAEDDVSRLKGAHTEHQSIALDAGHEWTDEFSRAAGELLARLSGPCAPTR